MPGSNRSANNCVSPSTPPRSPDPRQPQQIRLSVEGAPEGEAVWLTLAAVDLGILNLTGFESPDPAGHYFGQRRLGVEMRDVYGRLIDGMNGAMGVVRSGGDAGAGLRMQSPPPTQNLMASFSGPVEVGPDGTATVNVDLPAFNGTVRLMAVAWSQSAVGQAEAEMLVRDPVVVTGSLPRFLAPGDTARIRLEVVHADGAGGRNAAGPVQRIAADHPRRQPRARSPSPPAARRASTFPSQPRPWAMPRSPPR